MVKPVTSQGTISDAGIAPRARRPLWRRIARWTGPLILLSLVIFLISFAGFAERVSRMKIDPQIAPADAIVVLTGGQSRVETALTLLSNHKGKRLLISGVNIGTSRSAIQAATGADPVLFSSLVDIGYQAKDTVGNASETMLWLKKNGFKSVILVTNNYHMGRSLLELRRADRSISITPYPVVNSDLSNGKWMLSSEAMRVLLAEYIKYLGAVSRRVLPVPASLGSIMRL